MGKELENDVAKKEDKENPTKATSDTEKESEDSLTKSVSGMREVPLHIDMEEGEDPAMALERYLIDAVKNPDLISQSPVVIVRPPDDDSDDDEPEVKVEYGSLGEALDDLFDGTSDEPREQRSDLCWAQPLDDFLPIKTQPERVNEVLSFIRCLRDYTQRNIVLAMSTLLEESFHSEEIVLTTKGIRNHEYLDELMTPIGTFELVEILVEPTLGATYGRYYVPISPATLVELGLTSCATEHVRLNHMIKVPWIAESKISFPPQRCGYYVPGTKAMEDAMRFWKMFYSGEIAGFDSPEAEMFQSMLLSDEPPVVRLYNDSGSTATTRNICSEPWTLDSNTLVADKVELLDIPELPDIDLATKTPAKVLWGKDAIDWGQAQIDQILENYYETWHIRQYAIRR